MERKPVVLMVVNLCSSDCCRENGTAIGENLGELSLWMEGIKHRTITQNLRIKKQCKLNNLSWYIIREGNFEKLTNLWGV